jgi:hypothetical protein
MQIGHKGPRHSSVQVRVQPTDLLLHNSQESLQGQFNSSIETRRHAKQEHSGRSSSSDLSVPETLGGPHAADLVEALVQISRCGWIECSLEIEDTEDEQAEKGGRVVCGSAF